MAKPALASYLLQMVAILNFKNQVYTSQYRLPLAWLTEYSIIRILWLFPPDVHANISVLFLRTWKAAIGLGKSWAGMPSVSDGPCFTFYIKIDCGDIMSK